MPKQNRAAREDTPLARYLKQTRKEHRLTIRQAAEIAGVHPSVFGTWEKGGSPLLDSIPGLKRFCDHFKVSLSFALTGQLDAATNSETVEAMFQEHSVFDGYAHVKILHLVPRDKLKKPESD